MAGGLMQLVAYGAQDIYLTGNPKVTFFQAVYKRHTNFAMETIEQTVNGSVGNNGRLSVTVARNGDLIGDMFLQMSAVATLTDAEGDFNAQSGCWCAERGIADVELSIGGQRIDKHYQKWWRLYSELYLSEADKHNWGKMTSKSSKLATGEHPVYLPLIFFFNRNPGLYLPLIALQYHEVRLDIDLTGDFETYLATTGFKVWGNYVYLDTEERRRFSQKGHEYLIEQVQHTGTDSITGNGGTKQVRLSYNHPVKELVWCATASNSANAFLWNFTSNAHTSNTVILRTDNSLGSAAGTANTVSMPHNMAGAPFLYNGTGGADVTYQYLEDGPVGANVSVGPIDEFKLILNGQDRFKAQKGKYFNSVQPYQYHSGCPAPGIYSYSFALKPEEHQPTGTCNFSRIDNAQVEVKTKALIDANNETLHMFATNYNVLRVQSGMGGLAFSN
jgi:hypothetical protein